MVRDVKLFAAREAPRCLMLEEAKYSSLGPLERCRIQVSFRNGAALQLLGGVLLWARCGTAHSRAIAMDVMRCGGRSGHAIRE